VRHQEVAEFVVLEFVASLEGGRRADVVLLERSHVIEKCSVSALHAGRGVDEVREDHVSTVLCSS
jgi:hypothetical protein